MKVACIGQCSFGTEIVIAVLSPLPNVPLDGSKLTPAIPPLETDQLSEVWELPARVRVSPHIHSFLRVQSLGAFKERGLATKKGGTTDVGVSMGPDERVGGRLEVGVGAGTAAWFAPATTEGTGDGLRTGVEDSVREGDAGGMGELFRRGKATNSLSRMLSVHVIRTIQMRATRGRLMRKR
jgi:hypothetical protein